MNNDNYDQVQVSKEIVSSSAPYLQENMTVKLSMHDGNPVAIQLPQRVTLEVVETEPVTKGQTASSVLQARGAVERHPHRCAAARLHWHPHRGHDRGRFLRGTRQGLIKD